MKLANNLFQNISGWLPQLSTGDWKTSEKLNNGFTAEDLALNMENLIDEMARSIAEAMNGGKFTEAQWYNPVAKENWRKAVRPFAERLSAAENGREDAQDALQSANWYAPE